uniref:Gamma interferon inducible lysosomal thiol reductase GILT n=1 Tax=Rhabditophanes sp. KR3021 TaxID=114890 RepID=A0AC35U731_9BILA
MGSRCSIPRHLIFILFCVIILYLIIKINEDAEVKQIIIADDSFNDRYYKVATVDTLNDIVVNNSETKVHLAIFMESQCPDTSHYIHKSLMEAWNKLGSTGRVILDIVPFGKARCESINGDYKCECQHGEEECKNNILMNCVMYHIKDPITYVPFVNCIQGKDTYDIAFDLCIKNKNGALEKTLKTCSTTKEGRQLLAIAGRKTAALNPGINFVPWVMIDGKREIDAYYALEENLCNRLSPKPEQCIHK